jgi:hypothetical protein
MFTARRDCKLGDELQRPGNEFCLHTSSLTSVMTGVITERGYSTSSPLVGREVQPTYGRVNSLQSADRICPSMWGQLPPVTDRTYKYKAIMITTLPRTSKNLGGLMIRQQRSALKKLDQGGRKNGRSYVVAPGISPPKTYLFYIQQQLWAAFNDEHMPPELGWRNTAGNPRSALSAGSEHRSNRVKKCRN